MKGRISRKSLKRGGVKRGQMAGSPHSRVGELIFRDLLPHPQVRPECILNGGGGASHLESFSAISNFLFTESNDELPLAISWGPDFTGATREAP